VFSFISRWALNKTALVDFAVKTHIPVTHFSSRKTCPSSWAENVFLKIAKGAAF
jgi:hypothetical protein